MSTDGVAFAAHLDAPQVAAERGQTGRQALLVADVGEHRREGRQPHRRRRGNLQARLRHEHRQAQRLRCGIRGDITSGTDCVFETMRCSLGMNANIGEPVGHGATFEDEDPHKQSGTYLIRRLEHECTVLAGMRTLSVAVLPPVLGPVMVTTLVSGFTQTSIGTGSGARPCRAC